MDGNPVQCIRPGVVERVEILPAPQDGTVISRCECKMLQPASKSMCKEVVQGLVLSGRRPLLDDVFSKRYEV
jgi:hypothetical protein